jgi:predicted acyl esterase
LTDAEPKQEVPDRYVYDPLDTRSAPLYRKEIKNYITDQTGVLNLLGDGLVYNSEPFEDVTEVTGYLKFVAWIALDVPDTDFVVEVDEIKPDGTSIQLTNDIMRARYRDSLVEEKLVTPGEINRYEFNGFMFFSRRIAKWSQLRLVLTCPNSIYVEKNYNGGGVVAAESGRDARTAHVVLYHDKEHPSFLQLPIVK